MNIIDARGLECPKPVIKAKEAAEKGENEFSVWVDNEVAVSNVTRFLEGQGFTVKRNEKEHMMLDAVRTGECTCAVAAEGSCAVLFTSDKIGAESGGLGEVLMKGYIGTLVQKDVPPTAVALMNEGVKMALETSSVCDSLKALADKGVKILVCGTCAKHFGVTEQVKVGVISNMFEITEAVFGSPKPIVIG